jgi:hypothetical protein
MKEVGEVYRSSSAFPWQPGDALWYAGRALA